MKQGIAMADTGKAEKLIRLLPTDLRRTPTQGERQLIAALPHGQEARLGGGDPTEAATWGDDRVVRAEVLAFLCTDPEAVRLTHWRGVRLGGALVNGELDLRGAVLERRLELLGCALWDGLNLTDAHLVTVVLSGSHAGHLKAHRSSVANDIDFSQGKSDGQVDLTGATVGGDLRFNGWASHLSRKPPTKLRFSQMGAP